jgi:hypothetical protein
VSLAHVTQPLAIMLSSPLGHGGVTQVALAEVVAAPWTSHRAPLQSTVAQELGTR